MISVVYFSFRTVYRTIAFSLFSTTLKYAYIAVTVTVRVRCRGKEKERRRGVRERVERENNDVRVEGRREGKKKGGRVAFVLLMGFALLPVLDGYRSHMQSHEW